MSLRVTNSTLLYLVVSRSTTCSTSPVVSIVCLIITDLHKHETIQKIVFIFKKLLSKKIVIVKGAAKHIYRLLKVLI